MSTSVQGILDAFDSLAEADKHQAGIAILRRLADTDAGDLPEDVLVEAADELFRALDAEEERHATRRSRFRMDRRSGNGGEFLETHRA